MKLSVLLLTHNRPKLFQRALKSILDILPDYDIEVLVNNDTRDIEEIKHKCVTYYYKTSNDLSDLYHYLYTKSKGEYIYYLEDDDYIRSNFFTSIDFTKDINYMEYISRPLIEHYGPLCSLKKITVNRKFKSKTSREFFELFDDTEFQLGQILFKKILVTKFPTGNYLNNDYKLFQNITKESPSFRYISKQTWVQTTDGRDNISFTYLNTDNRFHEK